MSMFGRSPENPSAGVDAQNALANRDAGSGSDSEATAASLEAARMYEQLGRETPKDIKDYLKSQGIKI
jgi:hypothetical protein